VVPSAALFRVRPSLPYIALRSPIGGESWPAGSIQYVDFVAEGLSQVVVELSLDGGETYESEIWTADEGGPGWGHLAVTVPDTACSTAVLKVAPYLGGTDAALSGPFEIVRGGAVRRNAVRPSLKPSIHVRGQDVLLVGIRGALKNHPVGVDCRGRVVRKFVRTANGDWLATGLPAGVWFAVWGSSGAEHAARFRVM
jgi:hypothetical protein